MTTVSTAFTIPNIKSCQWKTQLSNIKLYVLNIIIDILTTLNPNIPQKYIYDPDNNNCEDNVIVWRKCLSMVKDDKLSEDKIWDENLPRQSFKMFKIQRYSAFDLSYQRFL